MAAEPPPVFRPGGISYLRIPAVDGAASAAFYRAVFGWETSERGFADATGHVIGHWATDRPPAPDAGIEPYVYVEDVDAALAAVIAHGGTILKAPRPEGDLRVAAFRDPGGNRIGVWQRARR